MLVPQALLEEASETIGTFHSSRSTKKTKTGSCEKRKDKREKKALCQLQKDQRPTLT